jgi:hypothetical protein
VNTLSNKKEFRHSNRKTYKKENVLRPMQDNIGEGEPTVGGGGICRFSVFLNVQQLNLAWQKNSEQVFFVFMSSSAEMSFWDPKKRKCH